jgi:hypothetical protein
MREIEELSIQNEVDDKGISTKDELMHRQEWEGDRRDEEVLGRWIEYFEHLLNVKGGEEIERPVYVTVKPQVAGPTLEEVQECVKCQRNGRAPGEDQLTGELLKCAGPDLIRHLHRLINEIWEREEMHDKWKAGLI